MIWDRWDDAMDDVLDEIHALRRANVKLEEELRARGISVPPAEKFEEPKARDHNDMYNNRLDEADHERRRKRALETALRHATPGRPARPDDVPASRRVYSNDGTRVAGWWVRNRETDAEGERVDYEILVWVTANGAEQARYDRAGVLDHAGGTREGHHVTGLRFDSSGHLWIGHDHVWEERADRPTGYEAATRRRQFHRAMGDIPVRTVGWRDRLRWLRDVARDPHPLNRLLETRRRSPAGPGGRLRNRDGAREAGWWVDWRGRHGATELIEYAVALWDTATGEELRHYLRQSERNRITGERFGHCVTGLRFDDDDRHLWIEHDGCWAERTDWFIEFSEATRIRRFLQTDTQPDARRVHSADGGRVAGWWIHHDHVTGNVRETLFGAGVWDAVTGRELVSYPRPVRADARQPGEREGRPITAVALLGEAGDELVIFYEGGGAEYLPVRGVGRYTVEQSWLAVERRNRAGE